MQCGIPRQAPALGEKARTYSKVKPGFCKIEQIKYMFDDCLSIVPPDLGNITEVEKLGISSCRLKVFQRCSKISIETRCLQSVYERAWTELK